MPRKARLVISGYPHHIAQRVRNNIPVFTRPNDYARYKAILTNQAKHYEVDIQAYCMLPDAIHLLAVPKDEKAFGLMFREAHRRFTHYIHQSRNYSGTIWYDRYLSYVTDSTVAPLVMRYIESLPALKGLDTPYDWCSKREEAHKAILSDDITRIETHLKNGTPLIGTIR